ncbi:uncharacterized protein LOC109861404 [Pseudomyrmex gracilis]|uniref:uncharacterized protein LOC109861404 n=1 Tax=Pseudomyrmex gracilis TaxID=219809 RepID=UPI000994F30B|nr:uncharacterized protein LOC109861404 [Pseudomyrmex gracilis]
MQKDWVHEYFTGLYRGGGLPLDGADAVEPDQSLTASEMAFLTDPFTEREVERRIRQVVPASWKNSNTMLVYKKGDQNDLENWRSLAMGDTTPNLFAAVVADRLTDWAIDYKKLCSVQKGFLQDEGSYKHNFVLQEILIQMRGALDVN